MKIVEELTIEDLISMSHGSEAIYTTTEAEFLSKYAPHAFLGKSWCDYSIDESIRVELGQVLFDIAVKLDNSAYRNTEIANTKRLIKEKAEILQDIRLNELDALMHDIIKTLGDSFNCKKETDRKVNEKELGYLLYLIKFSSLQGLKRLTPSQNTEIVKRGIDSDKFQDVRRELIDLFGDIPIMVYGSALIKENPSDIDTAVFPQEITKETYLKIMGKFNKERKVPLSFVIIPLEYVTAFALSDPSRRFNKENSVIINGSIDSPVISEEHFNKLTVYNAASKYLGVRTALTPEGLALCGNILPRINNRLKAIKFFYNDVCSSIRTELPEPRIIQFQALPTREDFVTALADANMQMYGLLKAYTKTIK